MVTSAVVFLCHFASPGKGIQLFWYAWQPRIRSGDQIYTQRNTQNVSINTMGVDTHLAIRVSRNATAAKRR
jgi:hypothetical protein